jgi:hypothetical protein
MQYTAKLHASNFRDVGTGDPKVLMTQIFDSTGELFRDHAHVSLSPSLKRAISKLKPNKSFIIQFEAVIKPYMYRGEVFKRTLAHVEHIKILGKA